MDHVYDVTDECMLWPFQLGRDRPLLKINGKQRTVTRWACEYHWGPATQPLLQAAHGPCRDTRCWNGAHLSWKTPIENNADKRRDGTWQAGDTHPSSKLTSQDVLAIRAMHARGNVTQQSLADMFSVSLSTVHLVIHRKVWASV